VGLTVLSLQREGSYAEGRRFLMYSKSEARRCGNTMEAKRLTKTLRKRLKADRKARIEAVAVDIETLPRDNEVHRAYGKLRGWYREKPGHVPKPTFQEEKKTRDQFRILHIRKHRKRIDDI
jgi:hypothetical protein